MTDKGSESQKASGTSKNKSTKCEKGQIERDGYSYIRKKTQKKVSVPTTCVSDKGKPCKGPKLIIIPEYDVGLLSKYGYTLAENHERRVKVLKKAIKSNSKLKILRHLNALRTLLKSSPKLYNKLDKDMKWIQKDYANKKGGKDEEIEDWDLEDLEEFEKEEKEWWENNESNMEMMDEKNHKDKSKKEKAEQKAGQKSSKKCSKKCFKKGGDNEKPDTKLSDKKGPWSLINFDKPTIKGGNDKNQGTKSADKKGPWSLVNFVKPPKKSSKKASKKVVIKKIPIIK